MRLDRLISLGIANPIRRLVGSSSNPGGVLPVLMYHSISDDPEPAYSPYYKVCTSPLRFAEQMQWLADAGYRGVTLSEGLGWLKAAEQGAETLNAQRPTPNGQLSEQHSKFQESRSKSQDPRTQTQVTCDKLQVSGSQTPDPAFPYTELRTRHGHEGQPYDRNLDSKLSTLSTQLSVPQNPKSQTLNPQVSEKLVAITFDDGFRDFHTAAFPALKKHGFTASMYLPTAFIGDERKSFKSRECLTWSEVRDLAAAGMEFGSHTVNHPKLIDLAWPEIEKELSESRRVIEQQLGFSSRSFAYPYAFPQENRKFTGTLIPLLGKLGYAHCATTLIGRVRPGDDPFALKRLPANSHDDKALFIAKLEGAYDWLSFPQSVIKKLKA